MKRYILLLILSFMVQVAQAVTWETEIVHTPDDIDRFNKVGLESDLVEDVDGHIHIAYRDGTVFGGELFYATNISGSWEITELRSFPEAHSTDKFALAVDSNKVPYIAYTKGNFVGFLSKESGSWIAEDIEGGSPASDTEISLLADSEDVIHALYFQRSGLLRYAKRQASSWSIETVADTGESFGNLSDYTNSLYLDNDDNAHIGYLGRNRDLFYLSNESGDWSTTLLASVSEEHNWAQKDFIVLPGGIFHMAVRTTDCRGAFCIDTGLEYLTNVNGSLEYETAALKLGNFVSHQSFPLTSPSLAVDDTGNIFVSYTMVFYPDVTARWFSVYSIYTTRKLGGAWSESPIEDIGFESQTTGYDVIKGLSFSDIEVSLYGEVIISSFNGNIGSLELTRGFTDIDGDGAADYNDNCLDIANPDQLDFDVDRLGDICDEDDDNDGLTDSQELTLGTNPLNPDTDDDGLADGLEVSLGTSPLSEDSDDDGYSDGEEVAAETDPLSANDVPVWPSLNIGLIKAAMDAKQQENLGSEP